MFRRKIEKTLLKNYQNENAKILIVEGARQVGKSFIVRNTAPKYFKNYIEIDLKSDYENKQNFLFIRSTKNFYLYVSTMFKTNQAVLDNTIIFLDEIQYYKSFTATMRYKWRK